ncbi:MAG: hypothetical protein L0387_34885, partial [Acidobacteria bacterium]|nr:hypothetical protein [Acidobacteriota bacterium]
NRATEPIYLVLVGQSVRTFGIHILPLVFAHRDSLGEKAKIRLTQRLSSSLTASRIKVLQDVILSQGKVGEEKRQLTD